MAFAVPMVTSKISYYQAENTRLSQADDVGFAARAPPLAVPNVAVTGGVTPKQGSAFALHGQEAVTALFGLSDDLNATNNTATIGGQTCVYTCVVDGTTRYVGITDDVARRGAKHLRSRNIRIEQIDGLDGLSRADARAVEQTLINYYGLGRDGGVLLNRINSISPTRNPTAYEQSLIRGRELLESVDYQWTN